LLEIIEKRRRLFIDAGREIQQLVGLPGFVELALGGLSR